MELIVSRPRNQQFHGRGTTGFIGEEPTVSWAGNQQFHREELTVSQTETNSTIDIKHWLIHRALKHKLLT